MYGVYILRSKKDNTLYTGYSNDVRRRLLEHQNGKVYSTREKRPIEMIFCELYKNRKDAIQREKFFKTGWGRNYIKKILYHTLNNI